MIKKIALLVLLPFIIGVWVQPEAGAYVVNKFNKIFGASGGVERPLLLNSDGSKVMVYTGSAPALLSTAVAGDNKFNALFGFNYSTGAWGELPIGTAGMPVEFTGTTEIHTAEIHNLTAGHFSVTEETTLAKTAEVDGWLNVDAGATFDGGNVTVNEDSGDYDFRVETDANINAFVVDAGLDMIGIGTDTPSSSLEVNGTAAINKTLYVTKKVTAASSLYVGTTSEFTQTTEVNGALMASDGTNEVAGNLSLSGQANIPTLEVAGVATITSGLILDGGLSAADDTNEANSNINCGKKILAATLEAGAYSGNINCFGTVTGTALYAPSIADPNDSILNIGDSIAVQGGANFNSDQNDEDFAIQAADTCCVFVDGTGNGKVGIATLTPAYELDVNGTGKFGTVEATAYVGIETGEVGGLAAAVQTIVDDYGVNSTEIVLLTTNQTIEGQKSFSEEVISYDSIELKARDSSSNSPILTLTADNGGTDQLCQIQAMYGADPYIRWTINGSTALDYHATILAPAGGDNVFDLGSAGSSYKLVYAQTGYIETLEATTVKGEGSNITGITLDQLSDVDVSGPSDNDVLTYDLASGTWTSEAAAAGGLDTSAVETVIADYGVTSLEAWTIGGNSFGMSGTIGCADDYSFSILTNNLTRFYVSSSGTIGVGTVAPVGSLDLTATGSVSSSIYFHDSTTGAGLTNGGYITFEYDGDFHIRTLESGGDFFFRDAAADFCLTLLETGFAGVGTDTPVAEWHITDKSAGYSADLKISCASIGDTASDGTNLTVLANGNFQLRNLETAGIAFLTAGVTREVIASSGQVSIAADASLAVELDVAGTVEMTALKFDALSTVSASAEVGVTGEMKCDGDYIYFYTGVADGWKRAALGLFE